MQIGPFMNKRKNPHNPTGFAWWVVLIAVCLAPAAQVHANADDIVLLKNGGRARGLVIESDPVKGTRIRLPDGTIRAFEAAAIQRIEYAGEAAAAPGTRSGPVPVPPPAAAAPTATPGAAVPTLQPSAARATSVAVAPAAQSSAAGTAPAVAAPTQQQMQSAQQPWAAAPAPANADSGWSAVLGSLRIESSEPGDVSIEGGEYGAAPVLVSNLSVGPHKVVIRFHAGDDDARIVHVRGGTETLVQFEGTAGLRAMRAHHGVHFGVGLETGVGLVEGDDAYPALNVILRANFAYSRIFEWHADLRLGGYPAELEIFDNSSGYPSTPERTTPGAALRIAGQLNLGSIYCIGIGVDAGILKDAGPFAGAHIMPLGFRMGAERSFLLGFQAGFRAGEQDAVADLLLGGVYLF
jgi:non-canonical (house-cleaning) NTP pyrophosphatase